MLDYQRRFFEELFSNTQNNNIAIYRNNYYGRTLQALQILYTATEKCLGEEFFQQAAISFARNHAPQHSHLHGYHFKFIKYLSEAPQTADIKYLKYLMYYEYLRELSSNAHKSSSNRLESVGIYDILTLNTDVMLFHAHYNVDEIFHYCVGISSDFSLKQGLYHYILYRDNKNLIQCDRVDYATYSMARLLSKNKNLTLDDVFAKLSIGEDKFSVTFSYFIVKNLLVKDNDERYV